MGSAQGTSRGRGFRSPHEETRLAQIDSYEFDRQTKTADACPEGLTRKLYLQEIEECMLLDEPTKPTEARLYEKSGLVSVFGNT